MSEFIIECAVCSGSFSDEKDYEGHVCRPGGAMPQMHIKMELPDEEEIELDVKPVIAEAEEVKSVYKNVNKMSKKKKKKNSGTLPHTWKDARIKEATNKNNNKQIDLQRGSINNSKDESLLVRVKQEPKDPDEEQKDPQEPKGPQQLQNSPQQDHVAPQDLCEVVNVKEEPQDADEQMDGKVPDPLAGSNMQDIMGLEDEDYLIENFVEYDQEGEEDLEIDEEDIDDIIDQVKLPIYRCDKTATVQSNVGKRILQTTNKGHECGVCNKKFFEKSMLDYHLSRAHTSPRPYKCGVCKKCFTHKNYVNLHMRVHTGEKPYQCELCSRSYSHKTSYTIHMRIHKGDRPYECSVCGKKCYDKSGLTSHMRSHTKETPYQCECCGRKFTHSKSLLVHRRNHTGEKPYICPHCGRAFRHWHKHKIHIRLHTGERPYKCKICNKGFPRNDEVKRHMKSHTGIKSFKCSICGVYCSSQASITGHINLHHVNLTSDPEFQPEKTIVENSISGVLGKKVQVQRNTYFRQVDRTSYLVPPPDVLFTSPSVQVNTTKEYMNSDETIVSTRPMTPKEKVNNKSKTYRQFLKDQEDQLLKKGLKVVSKKNNTYGLAPVTNETEGLATVINESATTSANLNDLTHIQIKTEPGLENAFTKLTKPRKQQIQQIQQTQQKKSATRIILPNLIQNSTMVLGQGATRLILQSVDQGSSSVNTTESNSDSTNKPKSNQPILLQTVGNSLGKCTSLIMQRPQDATNASQPNKQLPQGFQRLILNTQTNSTSAPINQIFLQGINSTSQNSNFVVQPQIKTGQSIMVQGTNKKQVILNQSADNPQRNKLIIIQSGTTTSKQTVVLPTTTNIVTSTNTTIGGSETAVTTNTSTASNTTSILHAALTINKSRQIFNLSNPAGAEIVLNKGVGGVANSGLNNASNTGVAPTSNPFVILQPQNQPIMQQQLLLLPGINGGPARLVIVQPQQPSTTIQQQPTMIKLENLPQATTPTVQLALPKSLPTSQPLIKQEPGQGIPEQNPMGYNNCSDSSATTQRTSTGDSDTTQRISTGGSAADTAAAAAADAAVDAAAVNIKIEPHQIETEEPPDFDDDTPSPGPALLPKKEVEDMVAPITMPSMIKLEPLDD